METSILRTTVPRSLLLALPAELRHEINTILFSDCNITVTAARSSNPPQKTPNQPFTLSQLAPAAEIHVNLESFPSQAFLVSRAMTADLRTLQPVAAGRLTVICEMGVWQDMKDSLQATLEGVEALGRVNWRRATTLRVNQDGVYSIDLGMMRKEMSNVRTVEVVLRDVDLGAAFAPEWVWETATQDGTHPVRCRKGSVWQSREFALQWLKEWFYHGWAEEEVHTVTNDQGNKVSHLKQIERPRPHLVAIQQIRVWHLRQCVAHLEALHSVDEQRVISVKRLMVISGWEKGPPRNL